MNMCRCLYVNVIATHTEYSKIFQFGRPLDALMTVTGSEVQNARSA